MKNTATEAAPYIHPDIPVAFVDGLKIYDWQQVGVFKLQTLCQALLRNLEQAGVQRKGQAWKLLRQPNTFNLDGAIIPQSIFNVLNMFDWQSVSESTITTFVSVTHLHLRTLERIPLR